LSDLVSGLTAANAVWLRNDDLADVVKLGFVELSTDWPDEREFKTLRHVSTGNYWV
jgi:hypothetical protein